MNNKELIEKTFVVKVLKIDDNSVKVALLESGINHKLLKAAIKNVTGIENVEIDKKVLKSKNSKSIINKPESRKVQPAWESEFEIMAETMDKQYTFHSMLKGHFPTLEDCPEKWKPDWIAGNKSKWVNWRKDKKIVRRIRNAAKKKCNV